MGLFFQNTHEESEMRMKDLLLGIKFSMDLTSNISTKRIQSKK